VANDIMDPNSSPVAQNVDYMVNQSTQAHHQQLIDELNSPLPASSTASAHTQSWFMGQGSSAPFNNTLPSRPQNQAFAPAPLSAPQPQQPAVPQIAQAAPMSIDERLLSNQLKQQANSQSSAYSNLRTLQPLGSQPTQPAVQNPVPVNASSTMTAPGDPAILSLASNDDLDVATLAREAKKSRGDDELSNNEVVISLR
jgi:hypothetical protein